jgi:hypothetical protein
MNSAHMFCFRVNVLRVKGLMSGRLGGILANMPTVSLCSLGERFANVFAAMGR